MTDHLNYHRDCCFKLNQEHRCAKHFRPYGYVCQDRLSLKVSLEKHKLVIGQGFLFLSWAEALIKHNISLSLCTRFIHMAAQTSTKRNPTLPIYTNYSSMKFGVRMSKKTEEIDLLTILHLVYRNSVMYSWLNDQLTYVERYIYRYLFTLLFLKSWKLPHGTRNILRYQCLYLRFC